MTSPNADYADTRLHVILGKTEAEHDEMMAQAWAGRGVPISNDPNYHAHPLLDIIGHLHQDGRRVHGHRPVVAWDLTNPVWVSPNGSSGTPS